MFIKIKLYKQCAKDKNTKNIYKILETVLKRNSKVGTNVVSTKTSVNNSFSSESNAKKLTET